MVYDCYIVVEVMTKNPEFKQSNLGYRVVSMNS